MAIATCPQVYSPPEVARRWCHPLWLVLAGMLALLLSLGADASGQLRLQFARIEHPAFILEDLSVEVGAEGRPSRLIVAQLTVGGFHFKDVSLACARLHLAQGALDCRGGELSVPGLGGPIGVRLRLNPVTGGATVELRRADLGDVRAELAPSGGATVVFSDLSLAIAGAALPTAIEDWGGKGRISGKLTYESDGVYRRFVVTCKLSDGAFSSPDGLRAAQDLDLDLSLSARNGGRDDGWRWQVDGVWTRGEAYLHPLYLTAGAALRAAGVATDAALDLERASLSVPGVRTIEASGSFDLDEARVTRGGLAVAEADLELFVPRYVLPLVAPAHSSNTSFSGKISAGIMMEDGRLSGLDLAFDRAGFSQDMTDLHLGPVDGTVAWRGDASTSASLMVGAGRWQKLTLGAFGVDARLSGDSVDIDRVEIPVLDGRLVLTDLALRRAGGGWLGGGAAVVEPISMRLLTEAIGLPPMSGMLAASMPGMKVNPGEVSLEGAMVISVFDGYLQATGLRVLEPFGVASRLYADVEARGIDLAQLTETFSFGSVTGFVDADVLGLELARWRPVRFDARMYSSPGTYRRRISQRAVQNIGALGGPGAALALQRGFLQFFESFGYRELGLSCKLARGVCSMGGLRGRGDAAPGSGFVIVEGGGIPALNVIGYNRRVDWEELLARLQRVIESNTAPVIR